MSAFSLLFIQFTTGALWRQVGKHTESRDRETTIIYIIDKDLKALLKTTMRKVGSTLKSNKISQGAYNKMLFSVVADNK